MSLNPAECVAARAHAQAQKFGAEIAIARTAARFVCDAKHGFVVGLSNGTTVRARAIIVASGVTYRKLALPDLATVGLQSGDQQLDSVHSHSRSKHRHQGAYGPGDHGGLRRGPDRPGVQHG